MADQAVNRPFAASNRGLDLSFGLDSPTDLNRENEQITGGLRYNGIIPHREQDSLAFGVVDSKISDQFSFARNSHRGPLPRFGKSDRVELRDSGVALDLAPARLPILHRRWGQLTHTKCGRIGIPDKGYLLRCWEEYDEKPNRCARE
jgi:hypothetical protein